MKSQIRFAHFAYCFFFLALSKGTNAQDASINGNFGKTAPTPGSIVAFDVSKSPCQANDCASPVGVDSHGNVAGIYYDTQQRLHGFYRLANGSVTTFDAPQAQCGSWVERCTMVEGISSQGIIVGYYYNGTTFRGFLRDACSSFTTLSFPNSDATYATAISSAGAITGYYALDGSTHVFLRDSGGHFKSFDPPGGTEIGMTPISMNSSAEIVGQFTDESSTVQAFLRDSSGNFTVLTSPGFNRVTPVGIDDEGRVVGYYDTGIGYGTQTYSFIRDRHGVYTTISILGSVGTVAAGINNDGTVVGSFYRAADHSYHGFYRLYDGTFVTFHAPNSTSTFPTGIGTHGDFTGYFFDSEGVIHGFVREATRGK